MLGVAAALALVVLGVGLTRSDGGGTHLAAAETRHFRATSSTTSTSTSTTVPPAATTSTVAPRTSSTAAHRIATATTAAAKAPATSRTTAVASKAPLSCAWQENFWPSSGQTHDSDSVRFLVKSSDLANQYVRFTIRYSAPASGPAYSNSRAGADGTATASPVAIDRNSEGGTITMTAALNDSGGVGPFRECTSPTYTVHYAN